MKTKSALSSLSRFYNISFLFGQYLLSISQINNIIFLY